MGHLLVPQPQAAPQIPAPRLAAYRLAAYRLVVKLAAVVPKVPLLLQLAFQGLAPQRQDPWEPWPWRTENLAIRQEQET